MAQKNQFEKIALLEIDLQSSKQENSLLKQKLKLQNEELDKLRSDYRSVQLNTLQCEDESSHTINTHTKKLLELTDTTNVSRVKILQLMHSIDDLTNKNKVLESYVDTKDKELTQSNTTLLLKCQQLETLMAKLQLQEQMIVVQTEETSKLKLDKYNNKVEINALNSKVQQLESTLSTVNKLNESLKLEISKMKTYNYSLSKTQTEKTLSMVPSSSTSATLYANYNRNSNKTFNRTADNFLSTANSTFNTLNPAVPSSSNRLGADEYRSTLDTPFAYTSENNRVPYKDELDDIYDVISQEIATHIPRKATTAALTTNPRLNLTQVALESRESKVKANRLMTR